MKFAEMNISDKARAAMARRQQLCWALKEAMGFPTTGAANDSVQMLAGQPTDAAAGWRIASIAAPLHKDCIYLGFKTLHANYFCQVGLAFRDELLIDWRPSLLPFAADNHAPVVLVDVERGGQFAKGERNMLVFTPGVPSELELGRRLAMARIRRTAASMSTEMSTSTWIPAGADPAKHLPERSAVSSVRVN